MDINIFDNSTKNTFSVLIIADDPAMEALIEAVLSPRFTKADRTAPDISFTVVCLEKTPPPVAGPCVYIGTAPDKLYDMQVFLPRPLCMESLFRACLELVSRITVSEGGFSYDTLRRVAVFKERKVSLTEKEAELFLLLLSERGECVPREKIENALWNGVSRGNCADVYICYLRKKLESIAGPGVLISVRGRGYMLKRP